MTHATLAVLFGNRDFFPDKLVTEARRDILSLFTELDIEPILLDETATKLGGVETWDDAKRCAELFRQHASRIDGVLVCLPNFGDEKGVADTIKLSGLDVPILVQAYPDNLDQFSVERRRDAFCGKVSVCNNLRQYGYPFTLTDLHTVHPLAPAFRQDLERFLGVCRIVNGLRSARLGAIGARPGAFNTVRYSEKLLQAHGMSVQTLDLSEVLGWVARLPEADARVDQKLADIKAYADYGSVPPPSLVKMARLGVVIEDWMDKNDLVATAIQCWTSLQRNFGVNVCTLMSIMSQRLLPSACEVDITGVVSMYALQLAWVRPARWWTGTTTTATTPTSASSSTAATGPRASSRTRPSRPRRSLARRWGKRIPTAPWPGARRLACSPLAASAPTTPTASSAPTWAKVTSRMTRSPPSARGPWCRSRACRSC